MTEKENSSKKRVSQTTCTREGYLTKRGGAVKNWKQRYFRILGDHLRYYQNAEAADPLGAIYLPGATIQMVHAESYPGHDYCFVISPLDTTRQYVIESETAKLRADWIESLKPAINLGIRRMDVNSVREGQLFKLSFQAISVLQSWSQRYCVVTPGSLKLYKHLQDISNKPLTSLDLSWYPQISIGIPSDGDIKCASTSSSPPSTPRTPRSLHPSTSSHPFYPFTLTLTPPPSSSSMSLSSFSFSSSSSSSSSSGSSSSTPRACAPIHYVFDCRSDAERADWMAAIRKAFVKSKSTSSKRS